MRRAGSSRLKVHLCEDQRLYLQVRRALAIVGLACIARSRRQDAGELMPADMPSSSGAAVDPLWSVRRLRPELLAALEPLSADAFTGVAPAAAAQSEEEDVAVATAARHLQEVCVRPSRASACVWVRGCVRGVWDGGRRSC